MPRKRTQKIYFGEEQEKAVVMYLESTDETEKNKIDLNIESGVSLVALTEAPTSNIVEWASPKYDTTTGNVYSQVSTGYHSPEAWKSVLFQICYAMAVLQEKELYIRNWRESKTSFWIW